MIFIVGASGALSKAFQSELMPSHEFCVIDRSIYQSWFEDVSECVEFFTFAEAKKGDVVINCAGVTNIDENPELIDQINFRLPKTILKSTEKLGLNLITFGSVLENVPQISNPYIESKRKLSIFLARSISDRQTLHLQLHTLYGRNRPKSHMFLGQIYEALVFEKEFQMTSGRQYREYWHVDEVAARVAAKIKSGEAPSGTALLSRNRPRSLMEIADYLFSHFDRRDLLKLGVLEEPSWEVDSGFIGNFGDSSESSIDNSLDGLVNYIEEFLPNGKKDG